MLPVATAPRAGSDLDTAPQRPSVLHSSDRVILPRYQTPPVSDYSYLPPQEQPESAGQEPKDGFNLLPAAATFDEGGDAWYHQ